MSAEKLANKEQSEAVYQLMGDIVEAATNGENACGFWFSQMHCGLDLDETTVQQQIHKLNTLMAKLNEQAKLIGWTHTTP